MKKNDKSFKGLLKVSFMLFKDCWFGMIKVAAVFFIPIEVLNHYFWQNSLLIRTIISKYSLTKYLILDNVLNGLVLLFFLVYTVAIMNMISAVDQGTKLGAIAAYKKALKVFGRYLWVKLLFLFKMLCWLLLLIVPGVIFAIRSNFSGMALLINNVGGRDALILSQKIIKPNARTYLAYVSLMFTILFIACALFVLNVDSLITYFTLKGNLVMARVADSTETVFIAMALSLFLMFYYYLYKSLGGIEEVL